MKLASDKIDDLQKKPNRNIKPGWGIRLEMQVKKFRQQAKVLKHRDLLELKDQKKTVDKSNNAI